MRAHTLCAERSEASEMPPTLTSQPRSTPPSATLHHHLPPSNPPSPSTTLRHHLAQAEVPNGTDGLVFVSAFGGLLAPHWRDDARGTLVGLTLAHDRRHVARAVLEGIAFQARDVVGAMEADTGVALSGLRVDGGVAMSNELLQYQADLCDITVERPKDVETTAMGAAVSAGLGAGVWSSVAELATSTDEIDRKFEPAITKAERDARCARWDKAVEASFGWASA